MSAKSGGLILSEIGTGQFPRGSQAEFFVQTDGHEETRACHFFFKRFRAGGCLVSFLNGGQYSQSILKSTARNESSLQKMISVCTLQELDFSHGISLVNASISAKN